MATARRKPVKLRAPSSAAGVVYRVQLGGFRLFSGITRSVLALILVGTLIGALFSPPPGSLTVLNQLAQTLAIAVIAFYFGTKTARRPKVSEEPPNGSGSHPAKTS